MKIVYLSPSAQLGGAERLLLDILASIQQAEPAWSLHLLVAGEGPLVEQARALKIPTTVVPFPPALAALGDAGAGGPAGAQVSRLWLVRKLLQAGPAIVAYVWRLRRSIAVLAPDVLHTNGFKMHLLGAWARPRGVPLIWHMHDYLSPRPVMARLLRRYAPRCALVIAISNSVARDVQAVCGAGLQVQTVYNGIDLARFSPTGPSADLDELAGLAPAPPDTVRVGLLATLARWKGHRTFLQALSLLSPALPLRAYVISGALYQTDGSQYSLAELKSLATELGLAVRVGFTGFLPEPAAAMRALDIVVHASTQPEPFGLVIAEGMACGRAVIVSETGGAAELLESEINALGHPPGDAAGLAARIKRLVTDTALRGRLGSAARVTAEQCFDRVRLATELIPIYRRVTTQTIL